MSRSTLNHFLAAKLAWDGYVHTLAMLGPCSPMVVR